MTHSAPRQVLGGRVAPRSSAEATVRAFSSRPARIATQAGSYRTLARGERRRLTLLVGMVACQAVLLMISLVPQTVWTQFGYASAPIPPALAPATAALFYILPTASGALARRWTAAVALATLPAWLDLGLFAVIAAPRYGPFYLVQEPHASNTAGTLELFAALGVLGWIAIRTLREGIRLDDPTP
jgi:hypothetical protein